MKWNKIWHFSMEQIQIWHNFSLVAKKKKKLKLASFNFIAKVSTNGTRVNLTVFLLIYKVVHYLNNFWNLFLDKDYLKNERWLFIGRMSFILFYSIIIKGNCAHLTVKISRPGGAKVTTIFRLSWKCFNRVIIKTF